MQKPTQGQIQKINNGLAAMSQELTAADAPGKINWANILKLVMEILPIVIAIFAEPQDTTTE